MRGSTLQTQEMRTRQTKLGYLAILSGMHRSASSLAVKTPAHGIRGLSHILHDRSATPRWSKSAGAAWADLLPDDLLRYKLLCKQVMQGDQVQTLYG